MQRSIAMGMFIPWLLTFLFTQNFGWALLAGILGGTTAATRRYYAISRCNIKKSRGRGDFTR